MCDYLKGPGGGREATTCCWVTVPQLFLPPKSVSKATWGCGQPGEEALPELGGVKMRSGSAEVSLTPEPSSDPTQHSLPEVGKTRHWLSAPRALRCSLLPAPWRVHSPFPQQDPLQACPALEPLHRSRFIQQPPHILFCSETEIQAQVGLESSCFSLLSAGISVLSHIA